MIARVAVPVVFEDIEFILIIAGLVIFLPTVFSFFASLIFNRKTEKSQRSYLKPALSGFFSGILLLVIGGSLAYATFPYLAGKEAFDEVSDYYEVNMVTEGSTLPVLLYEEAEPHPPTPVRVYTTPGGNSNSCLVYQQNNSTSENLEYVLYCGDPLQEHRP